LRYLLSLKPTGGLEANYCTQTKRSDGKVSLDYAANHKITRTGKAALSRNTGVLPFGRGT
jgi:hypothetical protein